MTQVSRRWPPALVAAALAALLMLGGAAGAAGHPATERFIPIGESPGLSEDDTYIGRIRAVDEATGELTVETPQGETRRIVVTPASDMWVDRSRRGLPPRDADIEDCRPGRRIEAKLYEDSAEADWVKIEAR